MRWRPLLATTAMAVAFARLATGAEWHVPGDFDTIQAAIDGCAAGDVVVVGDGVWIGDSNKNLDFMGKAITVRGEHGPATCIIDCQSWGRGFHFHSGEGPDSVVENLTIRNGASEDGGGIFLTNASSPIFRNCIITTCRANGSNSYGGGVHCEASSNPQFIGCMITDNVSSGYGGGGGVYCDASSPAFTGCAIDDNHAEHYYGGGIYCNNGSSPTLTDCTISGNSTGPYTSSGGGICCRYESSATLSYCTISDNTTTDFGGGLYCADASNLVLDHCTITGNETTSSGNGGGVYLIRDDSEFIDCTIQANKATAGAGVCCRQSNAVFTGCSIDENLPAGTGEGVYCYESSPRLSDCSISRNGGEGIICFQYGSPMITGCEISDNGRTGIYCTTYCQGVVRDCTITGNTSLDEGGGVRVYQQSDTVFINCTITANTAPKGGGVSCDNNEGPVFLNCVLARNVATTRGGGLHCGDGLAVINCVITSNTAPTGGGVWCTGDELSMTNCILWNDSPDEIHAFYDVPVITYCDVQGGWTGQGNIDTDPMFVSPGTDNYRLGAGSPCIDAGFNNALPIDGNDLDDDGLTCERFPIDMDSSYRFEDDNGTVDTGCGLPVVVDMGAYEYDGIPADVAYGDVDGGGFVDIDDVFAVLGAWGDCDGCCLEDVNADGAVDIDDVFAVLGNWGPCE